MDDCVDGSEDGCEELVDGAEEVVDSSSDGHFGVLCVEVFFCLQVESCSGNAKDENSMFNSVLVPFIYILSFCPVPGFFEAQSRDVVMLTS